MKQFAFWSAVGIVVIVGSYLVIEFLKMNREIQRVIFIKRCHDNRREAGFHAIARDHATPQS
jgi:hypothetical protein